MARTRTDAASRRRTRRWAVVVLALAVGLIAAGWLQVPPEREVHHPAPRGVSVIAHGGAQGHAPGNTVPAFETAQEQGADVLEADLQLTADDEVVAIHDGTVDRTTDGSGAVRDLTLAELRELDAGWAFEDADGGHPYRGQGVTIPTLAELLTTFDETHWVFELKTDAGPAIVPTVIAELRELDAVDRVTLASFSQDYLAPVREHLPEVPTNMPEDETYGFYVRQLVGLHPWWSPPGEVFQVPEIHDGRRVVTRRFVRAAERLGIEVQVWTVNEPADMHRLLDAGVHGILTDYPDRLVEVVEERAAERGVVRGPDPGRYGDQLDRVERLQAEQGWLTPVWRVVTFLGDEEFYLLVFPLLYWALHRRLGVRLGVMLLLTAGINSVLKLVWATPRPLHLAPEVGQVSETSMGLPSGHAQNGVAVWGLLAAGLRSWWARAGLVALIVAIGWSRIHVGAHFLEDTLVGWLAGALLLGAFLWAEPRVRRWWGRQGAAEQVLASLAASLTLVAPAVLLSGRMAGWQLPWPGVEDVAELTGAAHTVTSAGTLAGLGLGLVLLQRGGGFDHRGPVARRVLRVLVGLVGVAVLWQGLGAVFPGGEEPLDLVLRYLRYGLVGAWVGGIAPLLFVRLGLADPAPAAAGEEPSAAAAAGGQDAGSGRH